MKRDKKENLIRIFSDIPEMRQTLDSIETEFSEEEYAVSLLEEKFLAFYKAGLSEEEKVTLLVRAAIELTTQEAPKWEMIAARILFVSFIRKLNQTMQEYNINSFYEKIVFLTEKGLYGKYILESYTKEEIDEVEGFLNDSRNNLFNYS